MWELCGIVEGVTETGALKGSRAGFWVPTADASVAATGEAMTRVGATNEYYITDRDKAWWDPDEDVIVYDGTTPVEGCEIDYAGGYVTLPAAASGAVTVDCHYYEMEPLVGAYGMTIEPKSSEADITTFSGTLGEEVQWKRYVSLFKEWNLTVKRHFILACAWLKTEFVTENSNLIWTWKTPGADGNDEAIKYVVAGNDTELDIARAGGVTTVTVATDESGNPTSTAADIRSFVENDETLSELWDVHFVSGENGQGIVEAMAETNLHGGRDYDDLVQLGRKCLCCAYLNSELGATKKLTGVGILTGFSPDSKVDALVESDLTFRGTDRLRYHSS